MGAVISLPDAGPTVNSVPGALRFIEWLQDWYTKSEHTKELGLLPVPPGLTSKHLALNCLHLRRTTSKWSCGALSAASRSSPVGQGLTLVHFSAQIELFLTQNTPCISPNYPKHCLNTA